MDWQIHHKSETVSTNLDARSGGHGDVFTADFQTAGRGRLDHKWISAPGENLMMSAVLAIGDSPPEKVATLPLVVGLSVAEALSSLRLKHSNTQTPRIGLLGSGVLGLVDCHLHSSRLKHSNTQTLKHSLSFGLKWPNDVLYDGKKVAGILCERCGDFVIAGIGVNVNQRKFAKEIENRAISLTQIGVSPYFVQRQAPPSPSDSNTQTLKHSNTVEVVRDAVLRVMGKNYETWIERGFGAILPSIERIDILKGRSVSVAQTDSDAAPVTGVCGGIAEDGALLVGGARIYAGEAHVISYGVFA